MAKNHLLTLGLLAILALGGGCAKNEEMKVTDAVDTALDHLSQSSPDCQAAIDVLEDVGRQPTNSRYLQTLASAYACRGGFSELTLFNEIDNISADQQFLASLATLSTSAQDQADTDEFNDLQTAIDLLLYAGDKDAPSAAEQQTLFGTRQGGNLNLQALYMMIVQLGRYARWYGNADAAGAKGAGSGSSVCFFDYDTGPNAVATGFGASNACTGSNNGHPDLDYTTVTQAVAWRRLCQGAMLFNNILDVLQNTSLSSDGSLGQLAEVADALTPYISSASSVSGVSEYIAELSQEGCEASMASDDQPGQYYFASLFEGGLP